MRPLDCYCGGRVRLDWTRAGCVVQGFVTKIRVVTHPELVTPDGAGTQNTFVTELHTAPNQSTQRLFFYKLGDILKPPLYRGFRYYNFSLVVVAKSIHLAETLDFLIGICVFQNFLKLYFIVLSKYTRNTSLLKKLIHSWLVTTLFLGVLTSTHKLFIFFIIISIN